MSNIITSENGTKIPALAFGTWPLKGAEATDAIKHILELGYRHIDTAEAYENEDAVGQAIRESSVPREEIFLTTKFQKKWHGRQKVREALEGTLGRLGLDYVDLYLIHWPNPEQDLYVETCQGLEELKREGKIKNWGVSNFKPHHLQRVFDVGLIPQVNQISYDPYGQQADIQDFDTKNQVLTGAYSPLGRGNELLGEPVLSEIGEKYGKSAAQVVLRWHVQQNRIVVPRSSNPERQAQNLNIFDFELGAADLEKVSALDDGRGPRLDADEFGH